jgi:acetyl esterase/lipase
LRPPTFSAKIEGMNRALVGWIVLGTCAASSAAGPTEWRTVTDLDYVGDGNPRQTLDLFLPGAAAATPRPLVVFIHGGGWENGSKANPGLLRELIADGSFAGASLNYRLSAEAIWPAQIHDVKAALRWLRAHAGEHGIDPDRIAVFGISAGGHLAAMLGVSHGVAELEGALGPHVGTSSRVTCVIDFCGPANFLTFGSQGSTIDPDNPKQVLAKLIGGPVKDRPEAARSVSPVTHVDAADPPFLLVHGTKDVLVPYAQATEFDAALGAAGVPSILVTGTDAPHVFVTPTLIRRMRGFLERHLRGTEADLPEGPIPVPE